MEDAGALTATASSNGAEGTASMIRTFPEEVSITPENPDSSCKVSGQPVVAAAPTPPEGVTLAFANTVGFTVIDCDRNPNSTYPETLVVTIDVEQAIPEGTELYKVTDAGDWNVIEDAVIGVQSVTYRITDDGDLDQDKTPGTLRDPVALAYPASTLNCSDITDWSAAASNDEWVCQIDGQEYEYADFHVLTTNGTDVCANPVDEVPTEENDGQGLFCSSDGSTVRAIYDWDNAYDGEKAPIKLAWLTSVEQIGSRSGSCSDEIKTVAGRCANQLANGSRAFRGMGGEGGEGITGLDVTNLSDLSYMFFISASFNDDLSGWDVSNVKYLRGAFEKAESFNQNISAWNTAAVTDMSGMLKDAKAFDQDLSGWNVDGVTNYSSFDEGADNWCGLGFDNRGRPGDWSPTEAVGCLNVVLQAPESGSVGDEFDYVVQYYNASTTLFDSGVLTLELPNGVSVSDGGISDDASQSGRTITWTDIEVPAGSSANGGGGELRVGVEIGAGVTDGTELLASATLTDGAATSVNDVAGQSSVPSLC